MRIGFSISLPPLPVNRGPENSDGAGPASPGCPANQFMGDIGALSGDAGARAGLRLFLARVSLRHGFASRTEALFRSGPAARLRLEDLIDLFLAGETVQEVEARIHPVV